MNWYSKISQDITNISDALNYYDAEFNVARKECRLSGNIERANADIPGMVEHRYSQLQEIEAILELLNIEYRTIRGTYFKKYLEKYPRALSSRDCDRYIDCEKEVSDFAKIINDFALMRNKWLGITKAMDQKSYALNNIVKLRCAGLEDATL